MPDLPFAHLLKRDIDCPKASPRCDCGPDYSCVAIARTRTTCATTSCVPDPGVSLGDEGTNVGAIVGPVVAALVLVSLGLGWWALRRKRAKDLRKLQELEARAQRLEKAERETFALGGSLGRSTTVPGGSILQPRQLSTSADRGRSPTFDLPGLPSPQNHITVSASTTVKTYRSASINLDPSQSVQATVGHDRNNPFSDSRSVHTGLSVDRSSLLSHSTNVIPIAYVSSSSTPSSRDSLAPPSGPPSMLLAGPAPQSSSQPSSTDRHSLKSVAPSFQSFNSFNSTTIERANVVHISRPTTPNSSATAPSFSSQFTEALGLPSIPQVARSAAPSVRSPLSQNTATASTPLNTPSPSTSYRRNPFDDFPRPPNTPVTPSHSKISLSPVRPPMPHSPSYRSVSPSPDDDKYSIYSLGPERPPTRPASTASSIQSTAALHSVTLVQVGREHEGPAKGLFRSGSITRTNSSRFPHPPPPIPADQPSTSSSGPRDRSSAQTTQSNATTWSVLKGFPFILPSP